MTEERRRGVRYEVSSPVKIITSRGELIRGATENLSSQGAFIRCPQPLAAGEWFFLEIDFPSGETFRVPASVVWVRPSAPDEVGGFGCGMGVQLELRPRLRGTAAE
jgi:Tfp pilus assembly protein PilZ